MLYFARGDVQLTNEAHDRFIIFITIYTTTTIRVHRHYLQTSPYVLNVYIHNTYKYMDKRSPEETRVWEEVKKKKKKNAIRKKLE